MTNKKPGGATHNDIMGDLTVSNIENVGALQDAIRLMFTGKLEDAAAAINAVQSDLVLQVRITALLQANAIDEASTILFKTIPPKSGKQG